MTFEFASVSSAQQDGCLCLAQSTRSGPQQVDGHCSGVEAVILPIMELNTSRLILREFCTDDRAAIHTFASDAEVTRYTDWGPNGLADTTAFLSDVTRDGQNRPRSRFALAVVHRQDHVLIGSIELRITSNTHGRGEMGYVLGRSWWGRGYASEAAAAILRFGLDDLGLHKVTATCDPDNTASARVLTKIGMQHEGHLRDHLHLRDQWRDRMLYSALCTQAS
jgi:ribosomal-protein-alanine N-acetyltransferase